MPAASITDRGSAPWATSRSTIASHPDAAAVCSAVSDAVSGSASPTSAPASSSSRTTSPSPWLAAQYSGTPFCPSSSLVGSGLHQDTRQRDGLRVASVAVETGHAHVGQRRGRLDFRCGDKTGHQRRVVAEQIAERVDITVVAR